MKKDKPPTKTKRQAGIRQEECVLADAWLALWAAEDAHYLDASRLDISLRGCTLWLKGRVLNLRQRCLVETLVKTINGVQVVNNQLLTDE